MKIVALVLVLLLAACASIPGGVPPVYTPPVPLPPGVECTPNGCVGPPPAYPSFLHLE